MGRELKRVPLDFNYPLKAIWYGYLCRPSFCHHNGNDGRCISCKKFARIKGVNFSEYECPDFNAHFNLTPSIEPPKGEGYQLWETTSEGSPVSPVFKTLDELCEWAEDNATTFASFKATKQQWKKMLEADFVCHEEGNFIFI